MRVVSASDFVLQRDVEYGSKAQSEAVQAIIEQVKSEGDAALIKLSLQFDGVELSELKVSREEIEGAYKQVSALFLQALREASRNIRSFHEKQKRTSWMDLQPDGSMLGQVIRPLKRVGSMCRAARRRIRLPC